MPRTLWVLICKDCKIAFKPPDLGKATSTIELLLPERPEFPPEGKPLACPHCTAKATYTDSDLKCDFRLD